MARRRKRKSKVYYNSSTDTWSNDSMTEPYLMPGTEAYEAYQQNLENQFGEEGKEADEFHKEYAESIEDDRIEKTDKEKNIDEAYNVANRKFRRRRSKERQNEEIEKIIEGGLGKDIDLDGGLAGEYGLPSISSNDEAYDDGINAAQYAHEVIKDYKKQFEATVRDIPDVDNNNDGKIDEQDAEMTPGMKKMAKYI